MCVPVIPNSGEINRRWISVSTSMANITARENLPSMVPNNR